MNWGPPPKRNPKQTSKLTQAVRCADPEKNLLTLQSRETR